MWAKELLRGSTLPVFRVSGGSTESRQQYIQALTPLLENCSLSCVFLSDSEAAAWQSSRLLTQVRLHDVIFVDSGEEQPDQLVQLSSYGASHQEDLREKTDRDIRSQAGGLVKKLDELAARTPVWACILIGGKSSRMGRPKHLLRDDMGRTWLERSAEILSPLVDGLVVSGVGTLPDKLATLHRLEDIPGVVGPLTGIVAASRWRPMVSWLFVACDMPNISTEAVRWLLASRRAGCWGRVPKLAESKYCEPLFAWYDFRAGSLFEQQLSEGNLRIGAVAAHPKIDTPLIPESLSVGWRNINTPEQLAGIKK